MAALLLGALSVKATEFRRLPNERGGGGNRRTINGDLRGRSDWVRKSFVATLYAEDDDELAAIFAAADPDADITVSGDLLPSSFDARVEITGDITTVRSGDTWYYSVPISAREV